MKNGPLISVIVNCYNGEKYLKEALDSIYSQTYTNWEIVFFDNESTDNSAQIAKSYDSRVKYHYNSSNVPLGEARRRAVELSTGDWIAFLDCDDLWFPGKLERQIESVGDDKSFSLVYAGISEVDEAGNVMRTLLRGASGEVTLNELLNNFDINMVTPLLKRSMLSDFGLNFDPEIEASEEYNLFMQIAARGKVLYINECLGCYRVYESSLTNHKINKWAWERFRTIATLLDTNPNLMVSNYTEIHNAIDRGIYYKACYQSSINDFQGCRKYMSLIKAKSTVYFCLFVLAQFPAGWRIAHSKKWKGRLTRVISFVF